jgi:RIO-like serine/threonine protein kinase
MSLVPGETLENLHLTSSQKTIVIDKVLNVFHYLQSKQIVHGDINVSNVLFDEKEIYLIDWEMAQFSSNDLQDLYGPPWGIQDLFKRI